MLLLLKLCYCNWPSYMMVKDIWIRAKISEPVLSLHICASEGLTPVADASATFFWRRKCCEGQTANYRDVLFQTPVYTLLLETDDFQHSVSPVLWPRDRETGSSSASEVFSSLKCNHMIGTNFLKMHACCRVLCEPPLLSCCWEGQ